MSTSQLLTGMYLLSPFLVRFDRRQALERGLIRFVACDISVQPSIDMDPSPLVLVRDLINSQKGDGAIQRTLRPISLHTSLCDKHHQYRSRLLHGSTAKGECVHFPIGDGDAKRILIKRPAYSNDCSRETTDEGEKQGMRRFVLSEGCKRGTSDE
jgi:hypothetical protein